MAAILITCPTTGATVNTGQHVTRHDQDAVLEGGGRFRCSSCNQVHEWTKDSARLTEWPGNTSVKNR